MTQYPFVRTAVKQCVLIAQLIPGIVLSAPFALK